MYIRLIDLYRKKAVSHKKEAFFLCHCTSSKVMNIVKNDVFVLCCALSGCGHCTQC